MKTTVGEPKSLKLGRFFIPALLAGAALPLPALAQETGDEPPPEAVETEGADIYVPEDFERFAPRNVLDMIYQVPGFTLRSENQGRGLGEANSNVLVDGVRLVSKSESVSQQLARIASSRVVRIEIVDGASLGIPGLSGQVANVITRTGDISGRFEYRAVARPHYARPSYGGGEISVSGSTGNLEWTAAFSHGTGRGGAGGGKGTKIFDGDGNLLETRESLIWFKGEFPKISGDLKWTSPSGVIAHVSGNYARDYTKFNNDEWRHPVGGDDYFRDFLNIDNGYSYEINADVDLAVGPGRLKLIGIDRLTQSDGPATSIFEYEDGSPSEGSRFWTDQETGERIARAEYRWDMLGGNWEIDTEGAFNRYDRIATLGYLMPDGEFDIDPYPEGSGGVKEDRYESIVTHGRTLAKGLTMQLGVGAEYSKISQTDTGGVTRTFLRPKGSLTLGYTPEDGLDLSLKFARTVGQLSFGAFLASVNLTENNENAGNAELVPQQAWELEFEANKNLGSWGSVTFEAYGKLIEDYLDIIPVEGGESLGNIDGTARLYGVAANATINLDPLGWKGAKLTSSARYEHTRLPDPLTGEKRPFSGHQDFYGDTELRWDVPSSNWAFGGGFNVSHIEDYVRLYEVGHEWEGPIYTYAFIEHKDVFGMTVNFQAFNLTGGQSFFHRTVYDDLRDRSPVVFVEDRANDVSTIFRLQVKGNF